MPFVSIIMACHNAEKFLDESISSVIIQSFTDWELIIIDDNSTDNSLKIARSYEKIDKRVRIFSLYQNLGPGAVRNFGIENANGKWLAILDADDVFLKNKLEEQVGIINTNPNLVLIGSGVIKIDEDGSEISTHIYPEKSNILKTNLFNFRAFPPHSSLMYKCLSVKEIGGFNNIFSPSEDFDLWLRLIEKGDFFCLNSHLTKYRIHSSNISNKINKDGLSQIDYGFAAKICYILRERNLNDPSSNFKKENWSKFMTAISKVIKESGEIQYRDNKNKIRNLLKIKNILSRETLFNFIPIIKMLILTLNYHLRKKALPEDCISYLLSEKII